MRIRTSAEKTAEKTQWKIARIDAVELFQQLQHRVSERAADLGLRRKRCLPLFAGFVSSLFHFRRAAQAGQRVSFSVPVPCLLIDGQGVGFPGPIADQLAEGQRVAEMLTSGCIVTSESSSLAQAGQRVGLPGGVRDQLANVQRVAKMLTSGRIVTGESSSFAQPPQCGRFSATVPGQPADGQCVVELPSSGWTVTSEQGNLAQAGEYATRGRRWTTRTLRAPPCEAEQIAKSVRMAECCEPATSYSGATVAGTVHRV